MDKNWINFNMFVEKNNNKPFSIYLTQVMV